MSSGIVWPVSSGRISSAFGQRSAPTTGASTDHKGVDIAVPVGTDVMSAMSGTVSKVAWTKARGNYVVVDHSGGVQTLYQHLQSAAVKVGQTVTAGQIIAASGNTGVTSGPHLHFEVLEGGVAVDPQSYQASTSIGKAGNTRQLSEVSVSSLGRYVNSAVYWVEQYWYLVLGGLLLVSVLRRR